jgi:hypothetical protein
VGQGERKGVEIGAGVKMNEGGYKIPDESQRTMKEAGKILENKKVVLWISVLGSPELAQSLKMIPWEKLI